MSKPTKWRKFKGVYRRGSMRVMDWPSGEAWQAVVRYNAPYFAEIGSNYPTPEAAMKAADKWAARMLKALLKMEGAK